VAGTLSYYHSKYRGYNLNQFQIFTSPVEIWENVSIDAEVTQVLATDKDIEEFGAVMYFLASEDYDAPFVVNNLTVSIPPMNLLVTCMWIFFPSGSHPDQRTSRSRDSSHL
jgi:hypothetical protein